MGQNPRYFPGSVVLDIAEIQLVQVYGCVTGRSSLFGSGFGNLGGVVAPLHNGQGDGDSGAFALHRAHIQPSAVHLDDLIRHSQANA